MFAVVELMGIYEEVNKELLSKKRNGYSSFFKKATS
jgi:hypothetical protein